MTKEIYAKITDCVQRADDLDIISIDREALLMDLKLAYQEYDLDIDKLIGFDDLNFTHDILGIQEHINRQEMSFDKTFLPRSSK